ncbi:MAG TPA: hypothetical protein VKT76_14455 [Bradyrhizobium sp.]|nr:hypothetical protein [Bradyrhizobium sp.]
MNYLPGRFSLMSAVLLAAVTAASGQPAGKSPEQLGRVSFANSCEGSVQTAFERGVALLHSFWWEEGRRAFLDVLDRDPSCAIATWGIAAIDIGNPFTTGPNPAQAKQAQEAIARGRGIGAKTERERRYIEAVAAYYDRLAERPHRVRLKSLADAFEAMAKNYPDDDETQIFLALYLAGTQDPADKTYARTLKAAGILETQFAKHPDHPGVAHYLIHSYDYPPIAEKGLSAAKRYADIAPSAPHALHMPSHIFTRVGAWQESIATNQRSAEVSRLEGQGDQELHATDYIVYAALQLARDEEVLHLIQRMKHMGPTETMAGPFAMSASRARYALERGAWREAAELASDESKIPYVRAMPVFARALGAARSGAPEAAEKDLQELAQLVDALKEAKDDYWASEVEVQRLGAAAWIDYARGNREKALELMREAVGREDKSEKSVVTPGRLIPARELLGDMLLESGRPAEALSEYETSLIRDPGRFRSLFGAGKAAAQAGNPGKARYFFARLVNMVGPAGMRPELASARDYLIGH